MVAPLNCGADLPAFWYWRYLDQYWPKFYANCFPWFLEEIEIDQYPLAAVVRTTSAPFRLHARWIFPLSIWRNLGEMTKPLLQTCRWFAKRIWIIGCLAQAWRQISKSAGTVHDLLLLAVAPLTPRTFPFREAKSHPISTFRDRHRSRNHLLLEQFQMNTKCLVHIIPGKSIRLTSLRRKS